MENKINKTVDTTTSTPASVATKHPSWRFIAGVVACVICAIAAITWGVTSAQAADEKLTLIENHMLVTKGGVEEPSNGDEVYNTMSNFATITYDEEGNGTVMGLCGPTDVEHKIRVKLAGIGDGSTVDITDECEVVNYQRSTVKIPAKYMKQVSEGEARPVLYTIFNGDVVPDDLNFYHEVYVSVSIDGKDVYLGDSVYASDPYNENLHKNHTINGHDNYHFAQTQGTYLKNGKVIGDVSQVPYNVSSLFGGDNSFLNYDIKNIEVYTSQDDLFTNNQLVDNTNNQYYQLDTNTNQIIGLEKIFCFQVGVRIEATTKTDLTTNILNPKLQQNLGGNDYSVHDNDFTLMRVNGYEYSCDDGKTWQTDPHFTGLTAGTTYHVLQRPIGSSTHSQRINVTTTGTAPVDPSPDAPQPVVWTPPFNVGDKFSGKSYINLLQWPSATAALFGVSGYFDANGTRYYFDTTGNCLSPGFMCARQDASDVYTEVWCTGINTNTGVCDFKYFVYGTTNGVPMQNVAGMFSLTIPVAGNIELWKKSSNESITSGNACYSLANCTYRAYRDSACTDSAGDLTTNENGYAFLGNVNPGTYYVREEQAPAGMTLDRSGGDGRGVYEVYVAGGCTATVNNGAVYDDPQNDPVNVLIAKQSKDGKPISGSEVEKQSQGAATYKGAQFTVYYYDTTDAYSLSKDHDTRVAAAKRTWVFQTNSNGEVYVDESNLVKEKTKDELYYTVDDFGTKVTTLPVGTYVIEETLAPAGFTVPDYSRRTFIEVIRPDENSTSVNPDSYHKECYTPIKTDNYEGLGWNAWKINGEE